MGRRGCETDTSCNPEPPKKRTRTASNNHSLNASVNIEQPLPPGEVLTDVTQKQWKIGKPIGCGSFGEIYLASDDVTSDVTPESARYVLKIEPHSNGPLFVELHCLIRTAKHHMIKKWQEEKKLKSIGIPHFIANGSHVLDNTRYRFLVLPRYHTDLYKLSRSMNYGRIHPKNVLVLAAQILDVLEYLHAKGYTHSDIKSSNLMIGFDGPKFGNEQHSHYQIAPSVVEKASSVSSSEPSVKRGGGNHSRLTYSGYYEDEDFVVKNVSESSSYDESDDDRVSKKNKTTNRKGKNKKFNLRKPKTVNYGDDHSSVISDDSYQKLVKGAKDNKWEVSSSDEGYHEGRRSKTCSESNDDAEVDYFEEAVLSQKPGQIYLLDYGLASKFVNSDGTHKEFGMDQRKAHDGTLEFSSRDSHIGAHSRRSDLENLGYNVIDWLTGSLPWKTTEIMENPDLVHAVKKNYMNDVKKFLEACFKTPNYPKFLEKYFDYITCLEFTQTPDYKYCKNLFVNEFVSCGFGTEKDMTLNFDCDIRTSQYKKKNYSKKVGNPRGSKNTGSDFLKRAGVSKPSGRENLIMNTWESSLKMDLIREGLNLSNDGNRKPCASRNFYVSDAVLIQKLRQSLLPNLETPSKKFSPKVLRSKKVTNKKKKSARNKKSNIGKFGNFMGSGKQYTWAEILAGNPEDIIRKVDRSCQNDNSNDAKSGSNKKPRSRKVSNASEISVNEVNASPNLLRKDYLNDRNPTYAMKEVVANYRRKISGKTPPKNDETDELNESGYTYAMIRVLRNKEKRERKEKLAEEKEKKSLNSDETKGGRNVNRKVMSSKSTNVRNSRQTKTVSNTETVNNKDETDNSTSNSKVRKCNSVSTTKRATVVIRRCNVKEVAVNKADTKVAVKKASTKEVKQTKPEEIKQKVEKQTNGVRKAIQKTSPTKTTRETAAVTKKTTASVNNINTTTPSRGKQKTVAKPSRTIATRSKMLIRRNKV